MFTGIIEEVGQVVELEGKEFGSIAVKASVVLQDVQLGDSIAVNGVCLTVRCFSKSDFTADVMGETMRCTNLGRLKKDSSVNLERAMPLNGRFGGHMVSGHIDGTGIIKGIKQEGNAIRMQISCENSLLRHIALKGSITVDGISLTVASLDKDGFQISLIPHTGKETALLQRKAGDIVNLETDIIAKYVDRLLQSPTGKEERRPSIDLAFLEKCGF